MNCKVPYEIVSTGSQGNAVVLADTVLVDCGVPFKALKPFYKGLQLVLLTHIHSDHFRPSTLRLLAQERPTLRFGCGPWLVPSLAACGVDKRQIDVLEPDKTYNYNGVCEVTPVSLTHNVPNCGYKLHFPSGRVFYATDTGNLNGVVARNYDLYLVEANHTEVEIEARIREKKAAGEYPYEIQAARNHLSKEKCDAWVYQNIGSWGVYVYMHCHHDKRRDGDGPVDSGI